MMATFITEDQGICFRQWLEDVNDLVEPRNLEQTIWTKLHSCKSDAGSPIFLACVYGILGILRLDENSLSNKNDLEVNQKNSEGATPIYLAARYGHSALVQVLIEQGSIPNVTGGHFGNPLQVAAFQGFEAVAHTLLEEGASPNALGKFPTAIDAALAGGHEPMILLLLGYEQVIQSCELDKVLERAAHGGHFAVVCDLKERLKIGATDKEQPAYGLGKDLEPIAYSVPQLIDLPLVVEGHHDTLQMALFRGRARIAKAMLRRIADINESGGPFGNAIQAAAYGGRLPMVELILSQGGSVHLKGQYGTPLRAAALGGHDQAVQLLIDRGAVTTDDEGDALEAAAFNGRLSTVKILFDSGLYDSEKYTSTVSPAVRAACFRGHIHVATYLLTLFGSDAAHYALEAAMDGSQGEIVQLAMTHRPQQTDRMSLRWPKGGGCRMVHSSVTAMAPLEASLGKENDKELKEQFACKKKSKRGPHSKTHRKGNEEQQTPERMRKILGSNIDLDRRKDLLLIAVQKDLLEVVHELLDQGFDINSRGESHPNDSPQPTPIEEAVILGRVSIIELLLDRDAGVERGLQYAVVHQNERAIRLFLQKRPKVDVEASLSLAVEKGYPKIAQIMMDHMSVLSDFNLGSALATAVKVNSIPMIEMLLGDIELHDLPDYSPHSKEYYAFKQSIEQAAESRNISALKALLKHVGNHAMCDRMAHDYVKHSILSANWYDVVHCLHLEFGGLSWSTLLQTALFSLAERMYNPRFPDTSKLESDTQAKGRLLESISHGARESNDLLSSYPVAFQIAAHSRNTEMMEFILDDAIFNSGPSHDRFLGITHSLRQAALYYACQNGNWDMFRSLVEGDTDPFAKAVVPAQEQSTAKVSLSSGSMELEDVDFFQLSLGAFLKATGSVSFNWLPILNWFLDSGAELNREEPGLVKCLNLACVSGLLEYVEKLVEKGVSVSASWRMLGTPLHAATKAGQKQVAMYLVSCGADIHQQAVTGSSKTQTAMHYALEHVGDRTNSCTKLETCKYLVEVGASDADCKILLFAVLQVEDLEFAKRLLLRGICPDRLPTYCSFEMLKLLEEFRIDLISMHKDAPKQQERALRCGQFPLFEYLVSRQGLQLSFSDWSAMRWTSYAGGKTLQYMIDSWHFDINTIFKNESTDCNGITKEYQFNMLQKACIKLNATERVQMLLRTGASIDCPGLSDTALQVAVKNTKFRVHKEAIALVELLLGHGANVHGLKSGDEPANNEEALKLHTPPLLLVLSSDTGEILQMVKLLVKHGADVNAGVIPPLRVASQKGHPEVVKFLVQRGAVDNGNNLCFTLDDLGNERRTIHGIPMF
jgi:ankyrin repeat protein